MTGEIIRQKQDGTFLVHFGISTNRFRQTAEYAEEDLVVYKPKVI